MCANVCWQMITKGSFLMLQFVYFCSGQCKWLQMDRRVLDHDFSKKPGPIALNFLVR